VNQFRGFLHWFAFPVFFCPFLDRFFHLQQTDFNEQHLSHLNKTNWPIINYTIILQPIAQLPILRSFLHYWKMDLRLHCVDHPFSAEPGIHSHAAPCISMTVVPGSFFITTLQRNLNLNIPRKRIGQPQSQFPHSCVRERSIYFHVRPTYFPVAE